MSHLVSGEDTGQVYWGQPPTKWVTQTNFAFTLNPLTTVYICVCVCVSDESTVFGDIKLASHRESGVDNSGLCPVR